MKSLAVSLAIPSGTEVKKQTEPRQMKLAIQYCQVQWKDHFYLLKGFLPMYMVFPTNGTKWRYEDYHSLPAPYFVQRPLAGGGRNCLTTVVHKKQQDRIGKKGSN